MGMMSGVVRWVPSSGLSLDVDPKEAIFGSLPHVDRSRTWMLNDVDDVWFPITFPGSV